MGRPKWHDFLLWMDEGQDRDEAIDLVRETLRRRGRLTPAVVRTLKALRS